MLGGKIYTCDKCKSAMIPTSKQLYSSKQDITQNKKKFNREDFDLSTYNLSQDFLNNDFSSCLDSEYDIGICGKVVEKKNLDNNNYELVCGLTEDVQRGGIHAIIQWRKNNIFYGKFPIDQLQVLRNVIKGIEVIISDFDQNFQLKKGKKLRISSGIPQGVTKSITHCTECDKHLKLRKERDKDFMYCDYCLSVYFIDKENGEIICGIDPSTLDLSYITDGYAHLVNYYNSIAGITVNWQPALHQAILIVEDPKPKTRFFRFYHWTRILRRNELDAEWNSRGHNNVRDMNTIFKIYDVLKKIETIWIDTGIGDD